MNVKKLDFDAIWLEFHEIEPTIVKLGGKPTATKPDGCVLLSHPIGNSLFTLVPPCRIPWYTLPVIYDPATRQVVSDSKDIAQYLDKQYPTTQKLLVDPASEDEWEEVISENVSMNSPPSAFMVLHNRVSTPAGRHIRVIREPQFGATLEGLSTENAVHPQWERLEKGYNNLSELY